MGIPDPHPDPLVRGTDPWVRIRIRIHTKTSRIPNTSLTADLDPIGKNGRDNVLHNRTSLINRFKNFTRLRFFIGKVFI